MTQQTAPDNSYPHPPVEPQRKSLGKAAAILSILAMLGGIIAAIAFGAVLVEAERSHLHLPETPKDQQVAMALWALTYVFWTILGITGLVMGIVATVKKRGRALGITAIVVAALGPLVSFATWVFASVMLASGVSAN